MTQRKIFLLGNCQVRTLADVLRMVFPEAEVIEIFTWDFADEENTAGATQYLRSFDVQIRMPESHCTLTTRHIDSLPHQRKIDIPSITFPAYHPDLVYAQLPDGTNFRSLTDYHSAIGLWGWRNGLDVATTAALFCDDVFVALGYDRYWSSSVSALKEAFDASDLNFSHAWSQLVRLGPFMHTVNHPRPAALAALAKTMLSALGASPAELDLPVERYLHDHCESEVWPIYPFVARRLGTMGSWQWRVHDRIIGSVEEWIAASFASYGDQDPEDVHCWRLMDPLFGEVLSGRLRELGVRGIA